MQKLTFGMNLSLDGYIAAPGDDIGWGGPPSDELFRWWLDQERAIGEVGERIVERLMAQLLLQRPAFRHVTAVQDDAAHVRIVQQVGADHLDPAPAPVRMAHSHLAVRYRARRRCQALKQGSDPLGVIWVDQRAQRSIRSLWSGLAQDPLDGGADKDHSCLAIKQNDQVRGVLYQ